MENYDSDFEITLFNNPRDSDIILQLGKDKIYAHRVVLRLCSTFFNNALMSNFAVATNPVFELDEQDDDLEAITAMVKHMYGMKYNEHPQNTVKRQTSSGLRHGQLVLKRDLAVYNMADKYDCRAVRQAAVESFKATLQRIKIMPLQHILSTITKICGPQAPRLANQSLYNATIAFFSDEHIKLIMWEGYENAIRRGDVFDAYCTRRLMDAELIESLRLDIEYADWKLIRPAD